MLVKWNQVDNAGSYPVEIGAFQSEWFHFENSGCEKTKLNQ